MRTGSRRKRRAPLWPILLLMLLAAVCGTAAAGRLRQAARAEADIAQLRTRGAQAAIVYVRVKADDAAQTAAAATDPTKPPVDNAAARVQLLKSENPELVGWLTMAGAEVDYPVMQSVERPNFYLDHDFAGEESKAGLPYIDEACAADGMHRIIYGHNMRNGAMFGRLNRYLEADFFNANAAFTLDTAHGRENYRVIAVYETAVDVNAAFRFWEYTNVDTADVYRVYAANVLARSVHGAGDMPSYGQKLLTLVTCIRYRPNDRLLVVGAQCE